MINMQDLSHGEWYDGFQWYKGKQKQAETSRWMPPYFTDGMEGTQMPLHNFNATATYWTFEPNVISIGEPAA